MIQICRHILARGMRSEQPAVKGSMLCRHHSVVKAAVEREKATPDPEVAYTPIAFVFPEDRAAIQLNYFLVLQALNGRRIDNRTANTMNRLLHSMEQTLRQGSLTEPDRTLAVKQVVTMPDGEEVAMPKEAMEATDRALEHGRECPCAVCAEEFRGAAKERHHAECRCGACTPVDRRSGESEGQAVSEAEAQELYPTEPEPYYDPEAEMQMEQAGPGYQEVLMQYYDMRAREKSAMEALDGRWSGGYSRHRCSRALPSTHLRTATAPFTWSNLAHAAFLLAAWFHSR